MTETRDVAQMICRSTGIRSCLMDTDPERFPCDSANCASYDLAQRVVDVVRGARFKHADPLRSGAATRKDAGGRPEADSLPIYGSREVK